MSTAPRAECLDGVLIAGAGPVGLLTGLVLARAGIPVTVLEAEPEIVDSPRAIVYHSPTVELLDRLGLLDDARARGILKQEAAPRRAQRGADRGRPRLRRDDVARALRRDQHRQEA